MQAKLCVGQPVPIADPGLRPAQVRGGQAGGLPRGEAGAFGAAVSHKFAATVLLANSEAFLCVFIAIIAGCFIAGIGAQASARRIPAPAARGRAIPGADLRADLGCGARLSGNVAAFHPRFSLPCVFAPSAVGFALMARAVGLRAATAEDDEGVGYAPCPTDAP